MVIRIGNLAVVGIPGEFFCKLGMDIKKRSTAKHTMVIELANDSIGYLPTKVSFAQGGYESTAGSTRYENGSSERLVESVINQTSKLFNEVL